MKKRAAILVWLFATAFAAPAAAEFADGLAAYDAGDYQAAYLVWLPLANAGDGDSQSALAELYLSELLNPPAGVNERRRNQRTAVYWYSLAARCGNLVAQLNLGDLYARGVGVERDFVQAYLWLDLAARQGREWAARRRGEVAAGMTPAQTAKARALISDWRPAKLCRP